MHYAPCFNCDVDKRVCQRRVALHAALAGLSITSIKFRCDDRKAKFSPGQRIEFDWVWFDGSDDEEGLPIVFRGTILRERGPKFVVQVDEDKTANSEEVDPRHVFKKNDQLLIKVRPANMRATDEPARVVCPTCYLVEGEAEDRCYGNDYFHPNICMSGALSRSRVNSQTETPPISAEIEEGYF